MSREPNSQECIYFGRKLSNIVADIEARIDTNGDGDIEIVIGSENDDEIYQEDGIPTLKERVEMLVMTSNENIHIDLEDILRFAAKYCRGIYDRVGKEQEEYRNE